MTFVTNSICVLALLCACVAPAFSQEDAQESTAQESTAQENTAQESTAQENSAQESTGQDGEPPADGTDSGKSGVQERAQETLKSAQETAGAALEALEDSEQAKEASAGILKPIYALAEAISFPAFHWIAFAAMVTGVVSFGLQLTLGKLVVLTRLGFSISEILSDSLGLVVSLVGLVLTTQAAAENSSFTESATAVLSATLVGALAGIVFYIWGQRQELQAVEGRRKMAADAREQRS